VLICCVYLVVTTF